jgi:hypothetical protein
VAVPVLRDAALAGRDVQVSLQQAPGEGRLVGDGQRGVVVAHLDIAGVDALARDQIGAERGIAGVRRDIARPERRQQGEREQRAEGRTCPPHRGGHDRSPILLRPDRPRFGGQAALRKFVERAARLYERGRGEPAGSARLGRYVRRWAQWVRAGQDAPVRSARGTANAPLHLRPPFTRAPTARAGHS